MPHLPSPEQILALAPDAGAASAAQGLATTRKWLRLGRDERAAWGECQGSGKTPYRTQIDLADLTFRCTCPSRKLPCKHSLGLLLLANDSAAFEHTAPPVWVAEWLAKRDQKARAESGPAPATGNAPQKPAPTRSRAADAREAKVAEGVAELRRWLRDLVRGGLADAPNRPASFWSSVAARMVDAQAPGLARMVRELAGLPATGDGWQGRMLERIARLHLLLEGYGRLATLAPEAQADIRAAIGWAQSAAALREAATMSDEPPEVAGLRDRWLVLGQHVEQEDQLRAQRSWLWAETHARPALVLHFAMFNTPLDRSLIPGTAIDARLAHFPGAYPLRALVQERYGAPAGFERLPGFADLLAATGAYAAALAQSPWIERFPFTLHQVIPERAGERWLIRDRVNRTVWLAPGFGQGWRLLALSAGRPLALCGEWNGLALMPLSVWSEEGFFAL